MVATSAGHPSRGGVAPDSFWTRGKLARERMEYDALRSRSTSSSNDSLLPIDTLGAAHIVSGTSSRIACLRQRLYAREQVTVATLGGSVSAGSSWAVKRREEGAWLYHSKLVRAMNEIFPPRGVEPHLGHNGALPGTGPAFFEHCAEGQLPARHTDLVLLEFALNTDGKAAPFERLLRKLLLTHPRSAIVVINVHAWSLRHGCYCEKVLPSRPHCFTGESNPSRAERYIAAICAYYHVPLVSFVAGLSSQVRNNTLHPMHFMLDCRHPSGQGHTLLAQLMLARLLRP